MAQRWLPVAISLVIHGVAFIALIEAPAIELPRRADSEYKQVIAGKEDKLVWYKFRKELPQVTPPRAKADERPLRAAVTAKQSIVSSPKNAPHRDQMVWTPAPEIAPAPLLDSPNLLAVKLPELPAKAFVTPPDLRKPEVAKIDLPDAPELKAQATQTADLHNSPLPPKPFATPPAAPRRAMAQPQVAGDAPQFQALSAQPSVASLSMRLPPKPYVAPPAPGREGTAHVNPLDEAPQLAANVNPGGGATVLGPSPKLPPRPFTAPAGRAGDGASRSVSVEAAPALHLPSNSKDLNIAIVGLNPIDTRAPLPKASSPADFAAGPQLRPDGAASAGGGKSLSVPDLFVRGPRDAKPDLIAQAYAAPTSQETLRAAIRRGEPTMTVHTDAGSAKVSSAPDPRFNGRDVYMMAIQMPNLTSYSGSWLMWYSGRTEREAGLAPLSPPVAHRKVDPKYIATAAEERIEGRVQLACVIDTEGRVSGVELIRGADERLNRSAQEALAKWEFYPATRNGAPVEVDILVEIPFKLAPRLPQPR